MECAAYVVAVLGVFFFGLFIAKKVTDKRTTKKVDEPVVATPAIKREPTRPAKK